MKKFPFFSRVMAVLLVGLLCLPQKMHASQSDGLYFDFSECDNVDLENFTPTVFVKSTQVATTTLPTVVNTGGYKLFYDFTNRYGANVGSIDGWTGEITLTGETGMATVNVYNDDNMSIYDSYDLNVYAAYSFEVFGQEVSEANFGDILGDGTLSFDPETNTFTLNNLHKDYLAGQSLNHDQMNSYLVNDETAPTFLWWQSDEDVHIKLVGHNEILNAKRVIAAWDATVYFEGTGSLYVYNFLNSFVNGVTTNSRRNDSGYEVEVQGDITTNIVIDGASVTVERDVTYDTHFFNVYPQALSVNQLTVKNNGYLRAFLTVDEKYTYLHPADPVITLNELVTDASTKLYHYLQWHADYGFCALCENGDAYVSNTYFDTYYNHIAQNLEVGPEITVPEVYTSYDFSAQAPTYYSDMQFVATENDTYDGSASSVNFATTHTDEEVRKALNTIGPRTASWSAALPGTLTLHLPAGFGGIEFSCYVLDGYVLKVMLLDADTTFTFSPEANQWGMLTMNYQLHNSGHAVVYLQDRASGAPARKAQQQTADWVPTGLYLYGLYSDPKFIGATEPQTAKEDPENAGAYYSTFYHSTQRYALPDDGTEAYVASVDGNGDLNMTLIAQYNYVIPADKAVILKAPQANVVLCPIDAGDYSHYTMSEAYSASNDLLGVDEATTAPANTYVLSGHSTDNSVQGVGFYQFTGTIPAHKAYITYSGSQAPKRMRFIFDEEQTATGIDNNRNSAISVQKFTEDGKLMIEVNGKHYDAQGKMIK